MAKRSVILLLLSVALLIGLGLTMLASTSFFSKHGGGEDYVAVWRQAVWLGLAVVACVVTALVDYNLWARWRWWLFGLSIVGLLLCFAPYIGIKVNGASRWIGLEHLIGADIRFQPSELAKLALIASLAAYFANHENLERTFSYGLVRPGLLLAAIVGLIGIEVDLGNASVATAVGVAIMLVAGARWHYLLVIAGAGAAALWAGIKLAPNRFERVMIIFDLEKYKDGLGLQQWISLLAFGSGGLEGRGLGEGRMKLSYLPEADTDFIFPMVGEELGFWGAAGTALVFILLVFAGMCISTYAPNRFGKLLGFGLTFLLAIEALLNMLVTTALLPNKGLPLPFVSRGGSSLVAAMVAVGVLINIHRQGVHLTWDQLPVIRKKRRWTPQL